MHLKRYWHWFFLLLPLLSYQLSAQDCGNPFLSDECGPLTAAGGLDPSRPNIFCEGEEVEFINNSIGIDSTIYCWGDGSFDKVPGNQNVKHIYDFPDDTCVTNNRPLDIDIVMIVIKHCGDGKISSHRISTPVRIRLKPKADFMANAPLCNDKPIQLNNTSCPNDVMPTYLWNFGDPASGADNTSTEEEPQHSFSGGGDFPVTLSVTNQCGTDTETRIITVIAPPIAQASSTLSPTSGCLPLRVNLSNESTNITFFQWKISPNSGYSFLDSTSQFSFRPILLFTTAGTYTITLETENECGKSNWTQTIEVSEAPVVTFRQAPIGCERLMYTPDVDYAGSISSYRWTFQGGTPGTSTEANPQNIQYNQPGRYNVTLVVNGACGEQTFVQTVEVIGREDIIIEPIEPLCSSGDTIQLKANVLGGTWSGSPAVNAQGIFNPAQATIGTNTILYTYGPENCRSERSIDISVQAGTTLNVGPDTTICIDQGNLQFTFSPNGGTWSGNGMVDTSQGIFDPNQSGAGTFNVRYRFQEAGSGCVSSANKMVTVIGLPGLTLPDSTSICETAANINLNDLFRPTTNPGNGILSWSGPGVDAVSAMFNGAQAGGVGTYNLMINYSIPPGCAVSRTVQVRVTPLIQAMASPDTTVCGSNGTLRLTGVPAGGQWSGPGINAQTGEIDLAQAGAGMRAYTYVIQANTTCESMATTNVQIIAGGSVNAGQDIYICETETSVTLPSANPADGTWTGPLPVNGNQINIASLAPGNYNFTYTSPSLPVACNSDILTLNILSLPNVDFNSDSTACIGNEISFMNNTTNAQRFAWNFGDNGTSNEQNPIHIYNTAGAYSIVLEAFVLHPVTNQPLCSATSAKPIKVFQAPTLVDFTMDRDSGCAELAVTFDNISIGEELQFVWQFGSLQTSDMPEPGTIIFPQGIEDTTYQVTLAVANGCGSSNTTKTIHVSPKPQANFGITFEEPCSGDTLLVNNISTGNPGDFQWFLSTGQSFNAVNLPPIVPFTDTLPSELSVTLVTRNTCGIDSLTKTITINPTDVRALFNTSARQLCIGDTLQLTNFSTPGAPIRWTLGDGNTYNSNQVNHVFREDGIFEIVLYAEGCGFDSLAMPIEVFPLPELTLEFTPAVCAGEDAEFQVITAAPGSTLFFGDGDSTKFKISRHNYDNAGNYSLLAVAESIYGCKNTTNANIEIVARPTAMMEATDSICIGATATFASASTGAESCQWFFGDGERDDACNAAHTYNGTGIFPITLIAISDLGCTDTMQQLLFVRPTPKADFTFDILEACTPAAVQFLDRSENAAGVTWFFGDGNNSSTINPAHTYTGAGTFEVTLIATNDNVCEGSITKTLTTFATPTIETELKDNCTVAEGVNLSVFTTPGSFVTLTGKNYVKEGTFHEGLAAGDYNIDVKTPQGCEATKDIMVLKPQELLVSLTQDSFFIDLGDSVRLDLQFNQINLDIQWSPDYALSDGTSANPTAKPFYTTTYFVTVVNELGCVKIDTAYVEVQIRRDIFLPNTFTPDGSGFNDIFRVRSNNPAVVAVKMFEIYDRWGKLLFRKENFPPNELEYGWDGTSPGGESVQPGVYTYYAQIQYVDGVEQLWEGKVLLVR